MGRINQPPGQLASKNKTVSEQLVDIVKLA